MKPELSYLAHHANEIDKYREETCCVIGWYNKENITDYAAASSVKMQVNAVPIWICRARDSDMGSLVLALDGCQFITGYVITLNEG